MFRNELGDSDPRLASEEGTSLFGLYTLSGDAARTLFLAAVEDSAGAATISGLGRGSCKLSGVGIIAAFLSASISDLVDCYFVSWKSQWHQAVDLETVFGRRPTSNHPSHPWQTSTRS
jgi:hypothetical protein